MLNKMQMKTFDLNSGWAEDGHLVAVEKRVEEK